ncbi:MAG: 4-demethylwyosine synthase TYW1 [Candidatus Diapherotrites archaeon]
MIPEKIKNILKKQHYELVGKHSAVQICRWTKKSLRNEGVCYKEKFYGIKSHLCCQMSPAVMWCPNKCVHCWRAIELTIGEKLPEKDIDSPSAIIEGCIKAQRKLLKGFNIDKYSKKKQLSKADMKKYREAQEPMQFAISLSGEPTVYPCIGGLISELRKRGKTSFLVTNGLYPEKLKELLKENQLPTQLYISINTPNEELYNIFHRSKIKNAWEKLNETLELLLKLKGKTRTIFRMNLVKNLNMFPEQAKEYAQLIKKSNPLFVEIKGFMSVGFARERLGYDRMPTDKEMENFIVVLLKELKKIGLKEYNLLDKHEYSRAYVLGRNRKDLKIKDSEI